MIEDLRELEAGEPEVEDDHDADEALEQQQQLALLDQVGLAGLVDEPRDVGHRLVHRQLLDAGVGEEAEQQAQHADDEAGQQDVVPGEAEEAAPGPCVRSGSWMLTSPPGRCARARPVASVPWAAASATPAGPASRNAAASRQQPHCGRPSPPASQDSIQHDRAPCWMTATTTKRGIVISGESGVNATHGPIGGLRIESAPGANRLIKLDFVSTLAAAGLVLFAGYALERRRGVAGATTSEPRSWAGCWWRSRSRRTVPGHEPVAFDIMLQAPLMIAFFTSIGFGVSVPLLRTGGPEVAVFLALATPSRSCRTWSAPPEAAGLGCRRSSGSWPGRSRSPAGPPPPSPSHPASSSPGWRAPRPCGRRRHGGHRHRRDHRRPDRHVPHRQAPTAAAARAAPRHARGRHRRRRRPCARAAGPVPPPWRGRTRGTRPAQGRR